MESRGGHVRPGLSPRCYAVPAGASNELVPLSRTTPNAAMALLLYIRDPKAAASGEGNCVRDGQLVGDDCSYETEVIPLSLPHRRLGMDEQRHATRDFQASHLDLEKAQTCWRIPIMSSS